MHGGADVAALRPLSRLYQSLSLCVLIFLPLLTYGQDKESKQFFTAVCKGEPPGVVKFFRKSYECDQNVSSTKEKKGASDCFKEVIGVDDPNSYEGQSELLCKNLKDGKNWSTDRCEKNKLGDSVYETGNNKMEVSFNYCTIRITLPLRLALV